MAKSGGSHDAKLVAEIWDTTRSEIMKGWFQGPFTEEELTRRLGPLWVVSRRFGIWQRGAVRVLDDLR